jgi:hypothetical protein
MGRRNGQDGFKISRWALQEGRNRRTQSNNIVVGGGLTCLGSRDGRTEVIVSSIFFFFFFFGGACDVMQLTWLAHSHQLDLGGITPLLNKSTTEEIPLRTITYSR